TQEQLAQVKRLGDKFLCANLKAFQPVLGSAQRSHEHDWHRGVRFDVPRQFKTRAVRQTDIENHQVPKALIQFSQSALPGLDPRDIVLFAQQTLVQSGAERTIIFDQQQTLHDWYARLWRANSQLQTAARQRRA